MWPEICQRYAVYMKCKSTRYEVACKTTYVTLTKSKMNREEKRTI